MEAISHVVQTPGVCSHPLLMPLLLRFVLYCLMRRCIAPTASVVRAAPLAGQAVASASARTPGAIDPLQVRGLGRRITAKVSRLALPPKAHVAKQIFSRKHRIGLASVSGAR